MRYTSNLKRKGTDPHAYAVCLTITRGYRQRFVGVHVPELAPSWELLRAYKDGEIGPEEYTPWYLELLKDRQLTPKRILSVLPEECFLLCYEDPGDFCHRRILAKYIEEGTGVTIPEWYSQEERRQDDYVESVLEF